MFSGIITQTAKPLSVQKGRNNMRFIFPVPKAWDLKASESINIDGICTTIEDVSDGTFRVHYMAETLKRTSLSKLSKNHVFNLERPLSLNNLIGGHLVYGHIDTTGKVLVIRNKNDVTLQIVVPTSFTKYMVYKGSIAVNGVSLTIASLTKDSFSVSLIPHTLKNTNFGELKNGDHVNIETDMLAKYIEKLFKP